MDPVLIGEILAVLMFVGVIGTLLLGFPVAFSLGGHLAGLRAGRLAARGLRPVELRRAGVALRRLHDERGAGRRAAVHLHGHRARTLEHRRGAADDDGPACSARCAAGSRFSVIAVGALLAASTGVVGATVVTMGLISLPAMLRAGYDPKLACGVICASGTLGQIIPPSTVLIFIGDMLAGINAQVQMAKGNFAPTPVSVGDLFAGAMIPGLLLVAPVPPLHGLEGDLRPEVAARRWSSPTAERAALGRDVLTALLPPLLLIVAVLGSILGGHRDADRVGLGRRRRRR